MSEEDTLEVRLEKKLDSGEISKEEYQKLRDKFEKLGMLSSAKNTQKPKTSVEGEGSTTLKGGKVNGSVNVHGRAEVESSLECNRLFISGSVMVHGDLTVLGKSSISGDLSIDGSAKFVDRVAVSGRLRTNDNVYSLINTSLSGRTKISGDLVTEGLSLISGKTTLKNIRSTGEVRMSGVAELEQDLIAKSIEITEGEFIIGGNVKAEEISIFEQFLYRQEEEFSDDGSTDTISGLLGKVVNVVIPTLMDSIKGVVNTKPTMMRVYGDLEAKTVKLSYANIIGDIIGDSIEIGPNVVVGGTIYYRKSINLPPNHIYTVEKI